MQISRRALFAGGAAIGLVVAWRVWPEGDTVALATTDGETAFGGWIKIGADGHIVVAVPQCEHGQGVYTALPQIVADELGADWRTVGVEAAPVADRYANPLAAGAMLGAGDRLSRILPAEAPMLTGASTSVRMFEAPLRRAAAMTRALLCKAAVARWGGEWTACRTEAGFVILGANRARFGELAAEAAGQVMPAEPTTRIGSEGRLTGTRVPRLDAPPKVDGAANFAGDIRLPGMVFASIRQAPAGGRLAGVDRKAAEGVAGMLRLVETPGWVAAVAENWWAANRALTAIAPRFAAPTPPVTSASIEEALAAALARPGARIAGAGDVAAATTGPGVVEATYRTAPGVHAAIEPVTATATYEDGKLVLWMATQAPGLARAAAARGAGVVDGAVVLHPMMAGGSFGANVEVAVAEQAARLAVALGRPVQLTWSRAESLIATPVRAPTLAKMRARIGGGGAIQGWHAAIAAPDTGQELRERLAGRGAIVAGEGDATAIDGAAPAYGLPHWAVDHHAADIGTPTGWFRGGAHVATCFANECFIDELARAGGAEPLSYRIGMLGGTPRLARCLSTVAALGGWQGGIPGSGQGIACHAMRGSFIALMVEGSLGDGAVPRIERMVAAVDVGRTINPDLVRQAIEGGLIFGMAAAIGAVTGFAHGIPDVRGFRDLALPRLSTTPDITVEIVESQAEPGGASELGVPVVAPALANAIFAASGRRLRALPL
ncbi:xanthine dehydrogenase family protein molybdopterin-binding subunit [Sphingomonas sp. RS2018]